MTSEQPGARALALPSRNHARMVLCGAGKLLCDFARLLLDRSFPPPVVLTHPRPAHRRDEELFDHPRCSDAYESVFRLAEEKDLELIEAEDVNSPEVLSLLGDLGCTVAVSFGCRSIFRRGFLRLFDGRVLNCHSTDLPRYRGAASWTWMILNDERRVHGTIHLVDEGIDSGDLLLKKSKALNVDRPLPIDLMQESWAVSLEVLEHLLDQVERGRTVSRAPIDVSEGMYLPRLKSEENGAIDWAWNTSEIERFVRAFGLPYPGAFTFVGERHINLGEVEPVEGAERWHPYLRGLVARSHPDGAVDVVTRDGALRVRTLRGESPEGVPAGTELRPGQRLVTPGEYLHQSLAARPRY